MDLKEAIRHLEEMKTILASAKANDMHVRKFRDDSVKAIEILIAEVEGKQHDGQAVKVS